jgi:hypothetical protein
LREFKNQILKVPDPTKDFDATTCLMTTICTDRPLHNAVNDYHGLNDSDDDSSKRNDTTIRDPILEEKYGSNRFQRLIDFATRYDNYHLMDNNGSYAKLGMGPLWADIMDYIYPFIIDDDEDVPKTSLSIVSGHDSTIVPLLISLGPKVWDQIHPPYASMIVLELHAINMDGLSNQTIYQSNFAFRLIYNGQVITDRIEACPKDGIELCDITILLDTVKSFALRNLNCTRQHPILHKHNIVTQTKELESTKIGILITIILIISNLLIGSLITYLYMIGTFRHYCCTFYKTKQTYYPSEFRSTSYQDDNDNDEEPINNSKSNNNHQIPVRYLVDEPDDDLELI